MRKLFTFLGALIGSYAGWAMGAPVGIMTAFFVSTLLSGVGMYLGQRLARHYMG